MKKTKFLLVLAACLTVASVKGQGLDRDRDTPPPLSKVTVDDYTHYHNVGNLGLTVTNYGLLGQGYLTSLKDQPSCQYKLQSKLEKERIEHLSYAGLWIGGIGGANGEYTTLVSTAIVDGVFQYGEAGFEFTNTASEGDTVKTRSMLPTSPVFDPKAISHQDFICDFTDINTFVPGTDIELINHTPLGINVHLESYAWNYSFADAFVILNYTITNISQYSIDDVYIGLWVDASVANMNYTNKYVPGGGFTWYDNMNGFDEEYKMGYQYDADGDNGYAESYVGIRMLGSSVGNGVNVYYDQWQWTQAIDSDFPEYFMPKDDEERYEKLSSTPQAELPDEDASWMLLVSMGPLGNLAPGDSVNAVMAIVCGFWGQGDEDSPERRANLRLNSEWAQIAYNGEDVDGDGHLDVDEDLNGNGELDDGEDVDGDNHLDVFEDTYRNLQRGIEDSNGVIDRYILPTPPPSPKLKVIPSDGKVTLYWDSSPELFEDPITREQDFEGYRIYSSPKTEGSEEDVTLLAQFDLVDNLGYDTGFEPIRFDTIIDGDAYSYRFINENLLNGWIGEYFYSVTAYDKGNPANNLPSYESSIYENLVYAVPGNTARAMEKRKIYVYPNPYKANALWDGFGERERMIWFANLPSHATIRIYTLAGDLVDEIQHDALSYDGTDISLFEQTAKTQRTEFAGGEHAWDLITNQDQPIATGLYIYSVEDNDTGEIYTGKFLVIK